MKRIYFTIVFSFLLGFKTLSQPREIIGRILNKKTQKPIDSARVVVTGSSDETVSNHLGYFKLVIDTNLHKSLEVSRMGFKTAEIVIPKEDRFKFFIEEEESILKEPKSTLDIAFFNRFIYQNIAYPASARRMGLEGRVYARFEIDTAGYFSSIQITKGFNDDCDREVMRVLALLPSALARSLRVQTQFSTFILPVSFQLEQSARKTDFINNDPKIYLLEEIALTALNIKQEAKVVSRTPVVALGRGAWSGITPSESVNTSTYSTSKAGNGFGKGYILTKQGDTIKCLVEMAVSYESNVHYKMTDAGRIKSLQVKLIQSMTTPYKYLENIQLGKKERLMALAQDGKARLFSHVTLNEGPTQPGFGGTYFPYTGMTVIYLLRKSDRSYEFNKQNFKEVVVPILSDCPAVVEKIKNGTYSFDTTEKMIEEYNKRCP